MVYWQSTRLQTLAFGVFSTAIYWHRSFGENYLLFNNSDHRPGWAMLFFFLLKVENSIHHIVF